ncbi:DUF4276 family protein [Methylomagnum ishizawai]|uniref:DUF4276 family protein n=1 Tax=Methylomagnum ishizawai TaxID=1760988 RepID=UPI001C33301B|nr:DUF4276 family protein [Methylomagnum ishizawai]BBL74016.1 hypothetical protein MishRS11D_11140 [Methylomagnum ishizawai]
MTKVSPIVEGDGEVRALPVLLRRLALWLSPDQWIDVLNPIKTRRDRFLNRDEEFRRMLLLAAAKCGDSGWILILLDADDDCPAQLGAEVLERAKQVVPHRRVSVVIANREYEAWFIAAALSLDGKRGFCFSGQPIDPEINRDAKGWIKQRKRDGRYDEINDQSAFSQLIDLEQARRNSRSFRKLCDEWKRQCLGPSPEE